MGELVITGKAKVVAIEDLDREGNDDQVTIDVTWEGDEGLSPQQLVLLVPQKSSRFNYRQNLVIEIRELQ